MSNTTNTTDPLPYIGCHPKNITISDALWYIQYCNGRGTCHTDEANGDGKCECRSATFEDNGISSDAVSSPTCSQNMVTLQPDLFNFFRWFTLAFCVLLVAACCHGLYILWRAGKCKRNLQTAALSMIFLYSVLNCVYYLIDPLEQDAILPLPLSRLLASIPDCFIVSAYNLVLFYLRDLSSTHLRNAQRFAGGTGLVYVLGITWFLLIIVASATAFTASNFAYGIFYLLYLILFSFFFAYQCSKLRQSLTQVLPQPSQIHTLPVPPSSSTVITSPTAANLPIPTTSPSGADRTLPSPATAISNGGAATVGTPVAASANGNGNGTGAATTGNEASVLASSTPNGAVLPSLTTPKASTVGIISGNASSGVASSSAALAAANAVANAAAAASTNNNNGNNGSAASPTTGQQSSASKPFGGMAASASMSTIVQSPHMRSAPLTPPRTPPLAPSPPPTHLPTVATIAALHALHSSQSSLIVRSPGGTVHPNSNLNAATPVNAPGPGHANGSSNITMVAGVRVHSPSQPPSPPVVTSTIRVQPVAAGATGSLAARAASNAAHSSAAPSRHLTPAQSSAAINVNGGHGHGHGHGAATTSGGTSQQKRMRERDSELITKISRLAQGNTFLCWSLIIALILLGGLSLINQLYVVTDILLLLIVRIIAQSWAGLILVTFSPSTIARNSKAGSVTKPMPISRLTMNGATGATHGDHRRSPRDRQQSRISVYQAPRTTTAAPLGPGHARNHSPPLRPQPSPIANGNGNGNGNGNASYMVSNFDR